MPVTLKIGLSKEINLPGGSLAVSCNIEVEIDIASLEDADGFNRAVEQAYVVCGNAVDDELQRHGEAAIISADCIGAIKSAAAVN
jgi:hypothetical protein